MMDKLRTVADSIVLKIVLALIILSFILTGVGGYLVGGSNGYAVKLNGQEISQIQLEQAMQNERNRLQQQLGEQFFELTNNESYNQQLRGKVLGQLVNNMLLDQYTTKLSLNVSDDQVKASIRQIPYFETNNKFDNAKYLYLINSMGYTPDQFAQLQRQQLINQQLLQGISDTGFILPGESQFMSELILQQRNIRLLTIDPTPLQAQQEITDEALKEYYHQNRNRFITPEEVKVSYIMIDAAALHDEMAVSDEDINAYYHQHKSNYTQPERKNFSVIQFKTQAEAQSALDSLKNGADFATLAKEKSIDIISRRNGGELGWLEPNTTADELKQANLTNKGQLSSVIGSSVGYLIVRLNDIKPEQVKPLAEVKEAITKQVKQEKAIDAYYELQQKASEAAASDNESLALVEEVVGAKASETEWFTRETIPTALNVKPVVKVIFDGSLTNESSTPGNNSDVITTDSDRAFVIRINDRKPQGIQPFDKVQDQVAELVKRQKAQQQARANGEKLLAALRQGKTEMLKTAGLSFDKERTLSRFTDDHQLGQTVFALPHPQKDKPVYSLFQDHHDNTVLIELRSVTPGKVLEANEMKAFTAKIQESINGTVFDALMANLYKQAKIKMGPGEQKLQ